METDEDAQFRCLIIGSRQQELQEWIMHVEVWLQISLPVPEWILHILWLRQCQVDRSFLLELVMAGSYLSSRPP